MKKLVFKKWVTNTLLAICLISILVMASDCEDIKLFVTSHIIATGILILCAWLLKKYWKAI